MCIRDSNMAVRPASWNGSIPDGPGDSPALEEHQHSTSNKQDYSGRHIPKIACKLARTRNWVSIESPSTRVATTLLTLSANTES